MRALRRKRHLTLEQSAGATGLNRGFLSRLESGEKSPSIATTLKLAKALEVPTTALFGEAVGKRTSTSSASQTGLRRAARPKAAATNFGSPFYLLDGQVFWGQDRLEMFDKAVVQRLRGDGLALGRAPQRETVP